MPIYRRKRGHDAWHWCTNCTNYPDSDYDEETHSGTDRPSTGELCNECRSKEKAGNLILDIEQAKPFQKTLNILENEVGYMKRNMAVFKKLRQLVKSQEILQGTNWLLNWIVDTYTTDITMSIRRLVDKHPDPHCNSLYKFLKELETCT